MESIHLVGEFQLIPKIYTHQPHPTRLPAWEWLWFSRNRQSCGHKKQKQSKVKCWLPACKQLEGYSMVHMVCGVFPLNTWLVITPDDLYKLDPPTRQCWELIRLMDVDGIPELCWPKPLILYGSKCEAANPQTKRSCFWHWTIYFGVPE